MIASPGPDRHPLNAPPPWKRGPYVMVLVLGIIALQAGCSSPSDPVDEPPTTVDEPPPQADKAPARPFKSPPPPSAGQTQLPHPGPLTPHFPFLPDEDRHRSLSVGSVTRGYLVNAKPVPLPHPHLSFMPVHAERGLHYGSDQLIHLLMDAADHIGETKPQRHIHLGNLSGPRGGNIPHSVSHNSGRDADIGFFVRDGDDRITAPTKLKAFDREGRLSAREELDNDDPRRSLRFDTTANWRLVEGLIQSEAASIQYIFVSDPLRSKLLSRARELGADADIISQARTLLRQPGGAAPHDDHFHVRVHCAERDLSAGCVERGPRGPTHTASDRLRQQAISHARALLDAPDADHRVAAIHRLAILDEAAPAERLITLIDDADPGVRIAAIDALQRHPLAADSIAARTNDDDPRVAAEAIRALRHHPRKTGHLLEALLPPHDWRALPMATGEALSLSTVTANTLAVMRHYDGVPALIEALDTTPSPSARRSLDQALRLLTNHAPVSRSTVLSDPVETHRLWAQWFHDHADLPPDTWIVRGFQQAGYTVEDLGVDDVWTLTRAIDDERHLNVNAQLALKSLADHSPGSLRWSAYDANFFWRRYFERRQQALGLPPVPAELSTADGYSPPDD